MYRDDKDKLMQLSKFQGQPKKEILLLETKKIADVSPDMVQTFLQSKKKKWNTTHQMQAVSYENIGRSRNIIAH